MNEEKLFYIGEGGKEIAIPLNSIDLDRTRQLNAQEPVPLDLSGMVTPSSKQNQKKRLRTTRLSRYYRASVSDAAREKVDIVGPVCESGDFFALDREIPELHEGDLLAIMSAGAYGFVMASNYNSRPLPAEALVRGDKFALIRKRQTWEDLMRDEVDAKW